jgi:hypothetical protein
MADLEGHVQFQPTATWVAVEVIDSRFVPRNSSSPFCTGSSSEIRGKSAAGGLLAKVRSPFNNPVEVGPSGPTAPMAGAARPDLRPTRPTTGPQSARGAKTDSEKRGSAGSTDRGGLFSSQSVGP